MLLVSLYKESASGFNFSFQYGKLLEGKYWGNDCVQTAVVTN